MTKDQKYILELAKCLEERGVVISYWDLQCLGIPLFNLHTLVEDGWLEMVKMCEDGNIRYKLTTKEEE